MLYTRLLRPLIFALTRKDPEQAHEMSVALMRRLGNSTPLLRLLGGLMQEQDPHLERELCGIRFPNPVGLAGGFDKDGVAVRTLAALGFGFIEVGTVTLRPQPGNPRPRVFRLPQSRALINRMGFNNAGVQALARNLESIWPVPVPVGVSLGRNKATAEAQAADDYCAALRLAHPRLDYFAVNISSPNTPGLRNLQGREVLDQLLFRLQATAGELAGTGRPKPLFVKIAPDLEQTQIAELLEVCLARGVAGIIATNTTLSRNGIKGAERAYADLAGGLSGRPLTVRSRETVAFIQRETQGRLPIIGVGGIHNPDDALRMLDAGASLIQLYTGLVYQGPGLVRDIKRALQARAQL